MITQCPECGHDVSDKAAKCPQCGYPMQSEEQQKQPQQKNKIWLWITLAIVAVAAIGGAVWFLLKNAEDDPNAIVELTPEFIEKVQKYDKLAPFSEGRAAVCRGELWGYIDTKGNEVIPCQYSRAEIFHEGLAQVVHGDESFYINRKGKKVFDGEGGRFSDGLALLSDGRVVDINGKEKFKVNVYNMAYSMSREPNATTYTEYPYFENGVITIYTLSDEDAAAERYENAAEHSYDNDGKMLSTVVEIEHKSPYHTFEEYILDGAQFDNGNRTGLADSNRNAVIPANFSEVSDISNGVALVTLRENDTYYASTKGHDLDWTDGLLEEYVPRYYGYSDSQGNTTFSKETLNHIEEANRIGREKWATNMERRREEERKQKETESKRGPEWIDGTWEWHGYHEGMNLGCTISFNRETGRYALSYDGGHIEMGKYTYVADRQILQCRPDGSSGYYTSYEVDTSNNRISLEYGKYLKKTYKP